MSQSPIPIIRYATAADAGLLAKLGARTFQETFAADNSEADMAAYLASSFGPALQAAELADPYSLFLIAEIDGVAAGYAKLRPGAPPAGVTDDAPIELVRLYVVQQWLGGGVGAALMTVCLDEAQQRAYRTLWLGVWEHNGRAQAFYRKWGFRDVGQHVFQLGADAQRDILMERRVKSGDPAIKVEGE